MDFAADDTAFFSDFASPAELAGQAVAGIFSDAGDISSVGMRAAEPTYLLPESSIPSKVNGTALVISAGRGAGEWTVRASVPDGSGHVRLLLSRVLT